MGIDVDYFKEMVRDHMEDQPYKITCGECGDQLDCDSELDKDFDLTITVHQCKTCTSNAYDEGYKNAEISMDGRP